MMYCPPPPPDDCYVWECDGTGTSCGYVACEADPCFELEVTNVVTRATSETTGLFSFVTSVPTTFTVTLTGSEGTVESWSTSSATSTHTFRFESGCWEWMDIHVDARWTSPYGDGTYTLPIDRTFYPDCAYALDNIVSSPSTLRRGDWLTVTFNGSGFGSASGGEMLFYEPDGTLIAELPGTLSGDPNIDINWSDDRVQISFGPGYTSTYPLGWFPFKGRIHTDANGDTETVWSGFTVTD